MEILTPVIITAAIGLLAGILLAAAAKFLAVPVDEKQTEIRELLPGANCGGCGYSGCDGYAAAVASGEAAPNLCSPGGADTAKAIAAAIGAECGDMVPNVAVVSCHGRNSKVRGSYNGAASCAAAANLNGGPNACRYGCLGFGDCAAVCDNGAITVTDGVAAVDPAMCLGCGKCAAVCPRHLIAMAPLGAPAVLCRNSDKAPATRAVCTDGCLGCGKCVRGCPSEADSLVGGVAVIDSGKCTHCGKCADNCPVKSIAHPYN